MRHGRRRITWQGTALVIGAVAAGCALVTYVPQDSSVDNPFVVAGQVGDTLDLTYAELTVTDVRVADTLTGPSEAALAGGTFLVVDATWRATEGETVFHGAEVTDTGGRTYWPTTRGGCSTSPSAQPGYAWRTTYCFDVPRRALDGATVRLARGDQAEEHAGQRRDAVAVVDLGVSGPEADQLWKATASVSPQVPGYAPAGGASGTGTSTGDASTASAADTAGGAR